MLKRTHHCGQLRLADVDQPVVLNGWVNNYRDHGGVIFIDLRDREGLTQIVFHPENAEAHKLADKLRHEDVVAVRGTVLERVDADSGEKLYNPRLATGEIEINGVQVEVLNKAATPPFSPDDAGKVGEEHRLKHRYIDLRRPRMQEILRTRHRVTKAVRDYCDERGFYEVETPFLCRSTPEGARDFLVPSRLQAGAFYALPQSPQLFKQILMTASVDKYLQIVRCFRDEDPRADRQAEFTQIDLEMAFVERDDVMDLCEGMVRRVWKELLDVDVPSIPRMTYAQAMDRYGSDRPDLRFGMELVDVTDLAGRTDFKVFTGVVEGGGMVKTIRVPGGGSMSRKDSDALAEWVKQFGAGGLPVVRVQDGEFATGIAKFLAPVADELKSRLELEDGDMVCFGVDSRKQVVERVLGELRVKLAHDRGMIPEGQWRWLWVVDFPLVEYSEEDKRWYALHHPFTAPRPEDLDKIESDPVSVLSDAYDLVLNGSELGGGSIRIHHPETQQRVFNLLGINAEAARQKFGFLLDALQYGTPPHGGLAFGLDRLVMHIVGTSNIRDVIAFPKTQNGADLMTEAPAPVDELQLKELNLRVQSHHSPASAV